MKLEAPPIVNVFAGDYTCVAENSIGRQTVTATISVIADRRNSQRFSFSRTNQYQPTTTRPPPTTTVALESSIIESHDMKVTMGSTVQLRCHDQEQHTSEHVIWEKDGILMLGDNRHR